MKPAACATGLFIVLLSTEAHAQDTTLPPPTTPSWSALADLHPGTEVTLSVGATERSVHYRHYLVAASDSSVTMLSLQDPWLPRIARDTLRHLATWEPGDLLGRGQSDFVHRNVRVTGTAVYVSGEKVIDLSRAVETFARDDVQEIRYAPRTTVAQALLAGAGGIAGAIGGAVLGYKQFEHHKPAGTVLCAAGGLAFGTLIGHAVGSLFDLHSPRGVIYKRP